jgi:tetratricopeptide (TPR) repeat protein
MSTYLGNPSLSTVVKERVSSTFDQALALFRQGRTDEAIAGCTLILQMDPLFDPAKKLLEKARDPNAPIDIDALAPQVGTDDALDEARAAMRARDFERVVHLTTEILTNDLMNDEARVLGDQAREKLEAGPFIEQFVKKCEASIASGNTAAARADLEKARALDPDHPALKKIEQSIGGAAAPSSSFVVDEQPPTRGSAQATDFGFTFEEEKSTDGFANFSFGDSAPAAEPVVPVAPVVEAAPAAGFSFDSPASSGGYGGFSFDAPAAPPPAAESAPASGGFDFSMASIDASPDDQKKIDQYLSDGDRALEAGDYQKAIDIWSRIFLIDVTNEQASERIETAKAKKREAEQQVETILAAAVQAFDRKDTTTARAQFAEVLRLDPNNVTAQDYMDRLAGTALEGGASGVATDFTPPPAETFEPFEGEAPSEMPAAPAMPASRSAAADRKAPAAAKTPPKAAPAKRGLPMGALGALLGLIVLAAGGWFAWSRYVHPNSSDPAATQAVFTQASALAGRGQFDQAIALLQEIKAEDPQHDKAVGMIADLQHKKAQAAELIDGRPAAVFLQEQLAAGRAAYDAHDYLGAKKAFEQAMRVKPLTPDVKPMYEAAAQQVAKLDASRQLFNERRYADALSNLNQLAQQDPQNKNIQQMIVAAHFNLGATALQEERLPEAIAEFDEVLKADPNDELARRSKLLADRYNGQPKDLLYKIYVKYLPLRQVS